MSKVRGDGEATLRAAVTNRYSRQNQSCQSEILEAGQHGLYDDPRSGGFSSTAPIVSPYSREYQSHQSVFEQMCMASPRRVMTRQNIIRLTYFVPSGPDSLGDFPTTLV